MELTKERVYHYTNLTENMWCLLLAVKRLLYNKEGKDEGEITTGPKRGKNVEDEA